MDTSGSVETKKLKFEKGLAAIYVRHTVNDIENLSNEEIQTLIDKGDIDTSGINKGLSG